MVIFLGFVTISFVVVSFALFTVPGNYFVVTSPYSFTLYNCSSTTLKELGKIRYENKSGLKFGKKFNFEEMRQYPTEVQRSKK